MIAHELTPYEPKAHRAYVLSTFERGARQPREALEYEIAGGVRCVVAHVPGEPDDLMGWAAVEPGGAVVWCHVRHVLWRRTEGTRVLPPDDEGGGLATSMLSRLGVNLHAPTPCRYWSPMAARIAQVGLGRAGGVRIYHDPREERDAA